MLRSTPKASDLRPLIACLAGIQGLLLLSHQARLAPDPFSHTYMLITSSKPNFPAWDLPPALPGVGLFTVSGTWWTVTWDALWKLLPLPFHDHTSGLPSCAGACQPGTSTGSPLSIHTWPLPSCTNATAWGSCWALSLSLFLSFHSFIRTSTAYLLGAKDS